MKALASRTWLPSKLVGALALVAALAGCGGGGSGSPAQTAAPAPAPAPAPTAAPAPAPAPASSNPDLVTSVTTPTYAAGTTEKGGWDVLMAQRSTCGFGLLQQDTRLDVASLAHTYYLVQNSFDRSLRVYGHFEDATWNYFTGVAPSDRATHAGFPLNVSEILDQVSAVQSTGTPAPLTAGEALGASSMRDLVETVYHARGAFWGGRTGGIGATLHTGPSSSAGTDKTEFRLVSEVSDEADSAKQKFGTGNVATWPCAGLTAVRGTFQPATESPNPFPDVTSTATVYGTPVYFKADAGSVLVVSSATVTKVSDGSVLALRQLTKANDPAAEIGDNEAFLVPTSALAVASNYAVHATGTLNGTAFTRDFTFSTAP